MSLEVGDDLVVWINEQIAFWSLFSAASGVSPVSTFFDWTQIQAGFLQAIEVVRNNRPEPEIQQAVNNAVARVSFTARHPIATYMKALSQSDVDVRAIIALYAFYRNQSEFRARMNDPGWYPEAFLGVAFYAAYTLKLNPETFQAFVETFNGYTRETTNALSDAQRQTQAAEAALQSFVAKSNQSIDNINARFDSEFQAFKIEVQKTKSEYAEQFALRAPMQYWADKADRHARSARQYLWWFVGLLFVSVGVAVLVARAWLLPEMTKIPTNYWPIVLFSALVAGLVWPVRLVSKFYLSQRHLYEDCTEREVIARTFLALRDKVEMKDDDRKLLLGALFRDSTAGLVKDDQPVNLIDAVGSLLGKK